MAAWTITVRPRFGDIDGLRHVNNCVIPKWFELGQEPFFRLFHPELNLDAWTLIIAKLAVDYVSQLRLGSDVEIRTYIKRIGRSSTTVYQEAWQEDRLGAKADTVLVHYDYKTGKSVAIPDHIVAELERHLVDRDNPHLRTRSGRLPATGRDG